MRESTVETALREQVEAKGGEAMKFVSPGHRGRPDRLCLFPVAPEHIDIVAKYVRFVETKAPGKKPDGYQLREHARIRKLGFIVEILDKK
jgi:hypothetical protein